MSSRHYGECTMLTADAGIRSSQLVWSTHRAEIAKSVCDRFARLSNTASASAGACSCVATTLGRICNQFASDDNEHARRHICRTFDPRTSAPAPNPNLKPGYKPQPHKVNQLKTCMVLPRERLISKASRYGTC